MLSGNKETSIKSEIFINHARISNTKKNIEIVERFSAGILDRCSVQNIYVFDKNKGINQLYSAAGHASI